MWWCGVRCVLSWSAVLQGGTQVVANRACCAAGDVCQQCCRGDACGGEWRQRWGSAVHVVG
jgi:hypothetical protein